MELKRQISQLYLQLAFEVDVTRAEVTDVPSLRTCSALINAIEDLKKTTWSGRWKMPRLVIVGSESSGKSSLLERLCMLRLFPQAGRMCTVLPIKIRNNPQ